MFMRKMLSFVRRAVDEYGMINDGDRIAVGLSGGKDSLTLLCVLNDLKIFYPKKFELVAVMVDMGFPDTDFGPIKKLCGELGVELVIKPTKINDVVFNIRKETNPCSLCAKMRRGVLNETARSLGCGKVALGHHFDDIVETFIMNLFNEGRIAAFPPVTYLDRTDITVIRPLCYAAEKDVRYFASHNDLPVFENPCPADKHTDREKIKQLLRTLEKENKGLRHRIFTAMKKKNVDNWGTGL
ncbi:MAG: tRNA 2-thiocytidine(32) synthetase TtcA [Clostridia bacterium]|nr:tRNA 2-thiocytidine(32) synthetase TtcA [Clostridia bacterium]